MKIYCLASILAYRFYPGGGPVGLIVNIIIAAIVGLLLFYILRIVAAKLGIDADIVKLVGILIFVLLVLTLFVGCGTPITLSGAYGNERGQTYSAGATFTLPSKTGYAK